MSTHTNGFSALLLSFFAFVLVPGSGAAQPLAESTFDSGAEGWSTGENGAPPQHVPPPADLEGATPTGRPGGHLEAQAQNTGEIWFWNAPSAFTGDVSAAYNGALRFELTQDSTASALDSSDVILEGENTTLVFTVAEAPTSDWTAYRIPLRSSAGWEVQDTGEPASETEMRDVLGALQSLRIRGNYWGEGEVTGLENVRLQAAQTVERWVDPGQTYLQPNPGDDARDAIAINLANLGLEPSDQIHLSSLGEYDFKPSSGDRTVNSRLLAVFSGSDRLESENQQNRVPDAIDVGENFNTNSLLENSNIEEDFLVDGNVIEIPEGATHLFLSAYDGTFKDNIDPDGDYKLRIMRPKPPSELTITAPGAQVDLDWTASPFDSVTEYRIYRDIAPIDSTEGPTGRNPITSIPAGTTTYTDEGVEVGETYHYRMTAVDDAGNESSFGKEVPATPGPRPSPPSDARARANGDSSAVVRWQRVDEAEKYRLYRDTTSIEETNPGALSPIDSTEITEYTDTGLIPGQTYHYRITSVDPEGNESGFSAEAPARPPRSVVSTPDTAGVAQADTTTVDVLANDVQGNAPLDTTSVRVNDDASHGTTVVDRGTGRIAYVHDGSTNFDDAFTYVVEDRDGAADTAQVVLSIKAVTLTTDRDSIDLGIGQVNAPTPGPSAQLSFTNEGDTSAAGLSLTLDNQNDYAIRDDTGEEVLQPGDVRTVDVRFQPDEFGEKQTASVTLSTNTGLQSTVVLTGDGVGAQVEAPAEGDAAMLDEAVEVSITPRGPFFNPESRSLYARPGGGQYQRLDDASRIPASLVTTKGIDYYAVLEKGDQKVVVPGGTEPVARQNPFHLPVQFDSLTTPISLPPRTYRMVSVPAQTAVKEAFRKSYGEYDPASWRALRWVPSAGENGNYREFTAIDSLGPGMGLWVITGEEMPLVLGNGKTIDASSPQEIVIEPGWNQIATPFGFAVPWDTVQAGSGLSDVEIDGPVGYRDSTGYQRSRTVLHPWEGYFVFNATGRRDTLIVPPVSAEPEKARRAMSGSAALAETQFGTSLPQRRGGTPSTSARQQSSASARKGETRGEKPPETTARTTGSQTRRSIDTEPASSAQTTQGPARAADAISDAELPYTLRISAWTKREPTHRVWVGFRPEAQVGRDALDFAQVPPIGRTIRFSVRERIGGRSVPHAGSFKPSGGEGQSWTLVLAHRADGREGNGTPQTVRLQLNADGRLPEGHKRYLLDLDGERRLVEGETLSLKPGEQRRLKVIVGTEALAQSESPNISLENFENALRGNAPNPFADETTLTYVLEEKAKVTLEVYNVLGQRVRTLVQDSRDPGKHHVQWRGKNQYGEPVGNGVYFYRIEAGNFRETRKMVLVR